MILLSRMHPAVISMLPEGKHVRMNYILGENGILKKISKDCSLIIECSTIDIETSLKVWVDEAKKIRNKND